MKTVDHLSLKKGDGIAFLAVVILIVLSAAMFVPRQSGGSCQAEVYQDGKRIHVLDLNRNGTYTVEGEYTNVIQVRDHKISIIESDCPGGDCMHTGWISSAGQTIVCLPNRVEVRLFGSGDVDFAVR